MNIPEQMNRVSNLTVKQNARLEVTDRDIISRVSKKFHETTNFFYSSWIAEKVEESWRNMVIRKKLENNQDRGRQ